MVLHGGVWDWIVRNVFQRFGIDERAVTDVLDTVPAFLVILVVFIVLARLGAWALRKTIFRSQRIDPMVTALFTTLFQGLVLVLGFAAALAVFGVNVFGVALTVGLIGAGLALGLQNTVANVMGGISLALDRSFDVGDRIKIGDTWGDVEEIGLRSTKILTIRRELVTVPNRLLDQEEIWNYSGQYPELRVQVHVSISYDSDWRLAKRIILDVARAHPDAIPYPPPEVVLQAFADSGMELQLRVFIADARNRPRVESDLREAIKDRFDAEGIEIPFPYRTVVYKTDLPEPTHVQEDATFRPLSLQRRRILVATAGAQPARSKARRICKLAASLEADIVLLYTTVRRHLGTAREGEQAGAVYQDAAEDAGIKVRLRIDEGDVVESIARAVGEEMCRGVVIGAPQQHVLTSWAKAGVPQRLRARIDVPLIVVPDRGPPSDAQVAAVRAALDEHAPIEDDEQEAGPSSPSRT